MFVADNKVPDNMKKKLIYIDAGNVMVVEPKLLA